MPTFPDPYTWVDGDPIEASTQNTRFGDLYAAINGGLDHDNLTASAGILFSQLNKTTELNVLRGTGLACLSAGNTGDTVQRLSITSDGKIFFGPGSSTALDMLFKREDSNTLAVRNAADGAYKDFKANAITGASLVLSTALPVTSGGTGQSTCAKGDLFVGSAANTVSKLTVGADNFVLTADSTQTTGTKWAAVSAGKHTPSAKSSGFTANDSTNTHYLVTASSGIAITLPASPADGTTYLFTRVSGSGLLTFTPNGVETIRSGDTTDTTLVFDGGTLWLTAVTGGWIII